MSTWIAKAQGRRNLSSNSRKGLVKLLSLSPHKVEYKKAQKVDYGQVVGEYTIIVADRIKLVEK